MAEAALRAELKRRRIGWYKVASAGLSARAGGAMSAHAMQALKEAGIPFDESFASSKLTEEMILGAHAVVCMTSAQEKALSAYPNVTSFPSLCGREITDPYGQGIDVYRVTLRELRECLPRVIEVCCPKIQNPKS